MNAVKPDLEGLKEYIERSDREDALFFVGRDEIIDHVTIQCQRAIKHSRKGEVLRGATHLIQGAPGAGKTAILSELKRRWKEKGAEAPIVVLLKTEDLADTETVVIRIAEAVKPKLGRKWRTQRSSSFGGSASGGVSGDIYVVKAEGDASVQYDRGKVVNPESISFGNYIPDYTKAFLS